jgi:hypothetical protein
MRTSTPDENLTWENLIYVADFLISSNENHIALLGGEPTLHPLFVEFVLYLLERNFDITVFTSGVLEESVLKEAEAWLSHTPPEKLSFVVNVNHPNISTAQELEKVNRFLDVFGMYSSMGYNIYQLDFDFRFLADLMNMHGTRRHLRIGLAHPIPGEGTRHLSVYELKPMVQRLIQFAPLLEQMRIQIGFDCGMPMCFYSEEQLGILYKLSRGALNFGCGPAVDIGPDLQVWSCFPLSNFHKRSIYDFDSIQEVHDFYRKHLDGIRVEAGGILEACDTCAHREQKLCQGGCIAHLLERFGEEARIRPEAIYA